MTGLRRLALGLLTLALITTNAHGARAQTTPAPRVEIIGAGSTFIAPLMNKWAAEFAFAENKQVYYLSEGSGAGRSRFASSDIEFMTADALSSAPQAAGQSVTIGMPVALGAVVPVYHLPGLSHTVRFTPETLSQIFLGRIRTWNDPRLAADNPTLQLPNLPITVVHRSDASGTTLTLTDYLSRVSVDWHRDVGASEAPSWPVGTSAKGSEGLVRTVEQTPGALGYVELSYAQAASLPTGELRNQAGNFIAATSDSVEASVSGEAPVDPSTSLINASAARAWPISTATWVVLHPDMPAGSHRDTLLAFLHWALQTGQQDCVKLGYAPLPPAFKALAQARLDQVAARG